MLRWCRIVANQPTLCTTSSGLQAHSSASATRTTARLATTHFLRSRLTQQRLDPSRLIGRRGYEDPESVVGEPRVVLNRPDSACCEGRVEENPENCGAHAEHARSWWRMEDLPQRLGKGQPHMRRHVC